MGEVCNDLTTPSLPGGGQIPHPLQSDRCEVNTTAARPQSWFWHHDLVACERTELAAFYRRYLNRCNERRFDELDEFVDQNVEVNGAVHGLRNYGAGLRSVVEAFPNFHWDLQHLLIDDCWLGARLTDTSHGTAGRPITIQEFAIYRMAGGRIVAVWGDLDKDRLEAT